MSNEDVLSARIGEIVRQATLPIEAGKVLEFVRAIGEESPIYRDIEAARSAGFDGIPCPPTFSLVAGLYAGGDASDLPEQLGLDLGRVVHGEQTWNYHRTPLVGDVLTGVGRLSKVTARKNRAGRTMRMLTIRTEFVDAQGRPVVDEEMMMIELPKPDAVATA